MTPESYGTADEFVAEFLRAWGWLERSLNRYGPTHRREHVFSMIVNGEAHLWTDEAAAIVTQIITYPTGYSEILGWLAGGEIEGVRRLEQQAADWAKSIGVNRVRLMPRKGFKRALPGYRQAAVVLVKDL